ncbi:MAG: Trp family transcriptional regulator [Patescibacteria group bacterium]
MNKLIYSETEARQELTQLLADINSPQEIADFLAAFIKESEVSNLAKRVAILKLLEENVSYEDIQNQLSVSSATVSAVAQTRELPISQRILERIAAQNWADQQFKKIQQYFNPDQPKNQSQTL